MNNLRIVVIDVDNCVECDSNVTCCVLVVVIVCATNYYTAVFNPVDSRKRPPQSTSSSSDREDDDVEGTLCSRLALTGYTCIHRLYEFDLFDKIILLLHFEYLNVYTWSSKLCLELSLHHYQQSECTLSGTLN